jgi:hypothetical protein
MSKRVSRVIQISTESIISNLISTSNQDVTPMDLNNNFIMHSSLTEQSGITLSVKGNKC